MHRLRRSLSAAGLALAVMAMLACAPTMSRLLPAHGANWVEICTAEGMRDVALPSDRQDAGAPAQAPLQHHGLGLACAYCVLQAHQPMVAVASPTLLPVVAFVSHPVVVDEVTAAPVERPRATGQPRAPPRFA